MCKKLKGPRWDESKCAGCLADLYPENRDAVKIYMLCFKQMIYAGMNGTPVDIKHSAVHEAMRLFKVENRAECFVKVLKCADHMISIWNAKTAQHDEG